MTDPVYLFERAAEERRLIAQSQLLDPLTRRVFEAAGLAPGMRVLDLGAGVGDTSMLAARMVGPEGSVVGVDVSADPLVSVSARARAAAAGLDNIEFVRGDALSVDLGPTPFDAVVGRLVLMYISEPAAVLESAAARVRPGGVVCFHEVEATFDPCYPLSPLWERARDWFRATVAGRGWSRGWAEAVRGLHLRGARAA